MVETVTVPTENKGPSLEAEAAAQEAAAQAKENTEPKLAGEEETPDRPEWLPEKFKTPEDLAKAYAELEKARSKGETPKEGEEAEAEAAANEAVENAGLDMEALSAEYATNGELTQESLDALSKVGITPDMVDAYIAGQEAQAKAVEADLLEPVGGNAEAYAEMTSWAADNLSDTEIENFNTVLESGNTAAIKMAVQNLATKYQDANGQEPGRQLTGKGTGTGVGVYESTADLMKDMQSPEYRTNPAFRAKVEAKLARSNIL
jgi:hypothetical protein